MAAPARDYGTREGFLALYEELKTEIADELLPAYGMTAEVQTYTKEMLDYNVPGGKLNRGLTVVHCLQSIKGSEKVTEEEARKAAILGWCIEWLQAMFLVADDIMDASITRRGAPCWYRVPKVGMIAINDAFLLQAHLYRMLKKHFGGSPDYLAIIELFNETTWQTELGQLLDLTSQPLPGTGEVDLDRFTLERYRLIVKHKTAFYSFFMPVACGVVVAGLSSEVAQPLVKDILLLMGEYFQVQDDYLDCYAPPEVLGKIGTDIQDNKCSWLVVQALQRSSPEQRALLKAHYGKHGEEDVAAVKALYKELALEAAYFEYENESYAQLQAMIKQATTTTKVPEAVFTALLGKIYKRSK